MCVCAPQWASCFCLALQPLKAKMTAHLILPLFFFLLMLICPNQTRRRFSRDQQRRPLNLFYVCFQRSLKEQSCKRRLSVSPTCSRGSRMIPLPVPSPLSPLPIARPPFTVSSSPSLSPPELRLLTAAHRACATFFHACVSSSPELIFTAHAYWQAFFCCFVVWFVCCFFFK